MNYEFLLGKLFRLDSQLFVVSALTERNGITMARVLARVDDSRLMLSLPARVVAQHLICDQLGREPRAAPAAWQQTA